MRSMVAGLARRGRIIALTSMALFNATAVAIATAQARSEPVSTQPAAADPSLRSDVWITYEPSGHDVTEEPQSDGSVTVSIGHSRWPIFSVRLRDFHNRGAVEAEFTTPAGFDRNYVRFRDREQEPVPTDPFSIAGDRENRLRAMVTHHRPTVRLRIARNGSESVRASTEQARHETCARRLLQSAIEAQIRTAESDVHRRDQQERLDEDHISRMIAPPVESVSLLVQLAALPLAESELARDALQMPVDPDRDRAPTQWDWRSEQIRHHGLGVGLEIDLRASRISSAARLCRRLLYRHISNPRTDTCHIQAIVDRRDGWPITLSIGREGLAAADGTTERQYLRFNRVTPLEGFEPPDNPCR